MSTAARLAEPSALAAPAPSRVTARDIVAWASFLLALAFGAWLVFGAMLNQDVGFFLLGAKAMARGGALYEAFHDFNMPSNYWLPQLTLALARATSLLPADICRVLLLLLTASCAGLTSWLVRRLYGAGSTIGLVAPALFATAFIMVPGQDFGQREALFAAAAAPLLVALWARHCGRPVSLPLSCLIGGLAAAGASQKPHFIALLAGLGLMELIARHGRLGRIAPELWFTAAFIACYLIGVAIVYPNYLTTVLPLAAATYGGVAKSLPEVAIDFATTPNVVELIILTAFSAFLLTRRIRLGRHPVAAWLALAGMSAALFVIQRQGYFYHLLVFEIFLSVSAVLFAAAYVDASGGSVRTSSPLGPLLHLLVVLPLVYLVVVGIAGRPGYLKETVARHDELLARLRDLPPGTPIMALQTGVPPISPLHAYADVAVKGPVATLLALRPIMDDRDRAAATGSPRNPVLVREEAVLREDVLAALQVPSPELVIVDVNHPLRWFESFGRPFSILEFLREDPRFVEAWSAYTRESQIRTIFRVDVEVYRRVANDDRTNQTGDTRTDLKAH